MGSCSRSGSALAALVAWLLTVAPPASAAEEPGLDALIERLRTPPVRVLVLLQTAADFQVERSFPGRNGFSIANCRLGVTGKLDGGFEYLVRASLTRTPAVLDARLSLHLAASTALDMGLFKTPFSKEFLTSAGTIDFVNRAQVVTALVPGRQIGVQLRGATGHGRLEYAAGIWNGNSPASNGNDDDAFLYAARLAVRPRAAPDRAGDDLEIGVNGAFSRDGRVDLLGGRLADFAGRRGLAGADLRWTPGAWLVSGELLGARLEPGGGVRYEPSGFHVTAGRRVSPRFQLLARWERFTPAGLGRDQELAIAGLNVTMSRTVGIQANYVVPTDTGPEHHQLLLNAQVDF